MARRHPCVFGADRTFFMAVAYLAAVTIPPASPSRMCLRLHLLQDRRGKFGAAIVNFLKYCFTVIRPAMLRQSTRLAKPITRVERVDDVGPALAVHPSHHRRRFVLLPLFSTVRPCRRSV